MDLSRMSFAALCAAVFVLFVAGTSTRAEENAAGAATAETFEGIMLVVWGDPHPDSEFEGDVRYSLALPDGTILELDMNGLESEAVLNFQKRVVISGSFDQSATAARGTQADGTLVVQSITPTEPAVAASTTANTVLGTRKVIYLLAKYSDDTAVPHAPSWYTDLNNPDTPPGGLPSGETFPTTMNGFFKRSSTNQFSWVGDVGGVGGVGASGGWLTLPQPKSYYANCTSGSCAAGNLSKLADDATALGRAQGINFTLYDNINFVLSNDLDCCAWGGGYYSSVDSKVYGATWEPPWGQNTTTYGHEMGHSLGLPHSGWVYSAYDSPWDIMSGGRSLNSTVCGNYYSRNRAANRDIYCSEPGADNIIAHKDHLGWIPSANMVVTDTTTPLTVAVEGSTIPMTTATKMIKVCLAAYPCSYASSAGTGVGPNARYFTIEARVKGLGTDSQYDNAITGEGVIIHEVQFDRAKISGTCYFNNQSGWALPIDATPGDWEAAPTCTRGTRTFPDYALYNAQWNPGQTYTNGTYGLTVEVVSRTGSTFLVSIAGGAPAAPTNVVATATSTTSVGITWTASPTATMYEVARSTNGTSYTTLDTTAALTYTDNTASASTAYLYKVRATAPGTGVYSTPDLATTVLFTDPTLTPGTTTMKAAHITELRTAVNAVRTLAGSGTTSFTDATLTAGTTSAKAVHLTELRSALDTPRSTLGLAAVTYTDSTVTAGTTVIKAAHINDLRNGVK